MQSLQKCAKCKKPDARAVQTLSRLEITLAPHRNLSEDYWITSKRYFHDTYDFAIINNNSELSKKMGISLIQINGEPSEIVNCSGRSVYIYGKDKLSVVLKPDTSLVWKGCELPTGIGYYTQDCTIENINPSAKGLLTHGPYVKLRPGKYHFEFTYISPESQSIEVGEWDVHTFPSKEASKAKIIIAKPTITKGTIEGSNGAIRKFSSFFVIESELSQYLFEIRTFSNGTPLKIIQLNIKRLE